jgi:hypothetical protein
MQRRRHRRRPRANNNKSSSNDSNVVDKAAEGDFWENYYFQVTPMQEHQQHINHSSTRKNRETMIFIEVPTTTMAMTGI